MLIDTGKELPIANKKMAFPRSIALRTDWQANEHTGKVNYRVALQLKKYVLLFLKTLTMFNLNRFLKLEN